MSPRYSVAGLYISTLPTVLFLLPHAHRSMSQLASNLARSSQRNSELLSTLSQTDYAPPALKQNAAYISDLETQIKTLDRDLRRLHQVTEDERKEHLKYRDSTVKRFAYKLGGHKGAEKFSTRQQKEEREFLEAWQKERKAKDRREVRSTLKWSFFM